MDKEKIAWLESIGAKKWPEPIVYTYTFKDYGGDFNLSKRYIEETSLEEMKAQYERNRALAEEVAKVRKTQVYFRSNECF